MVVSRSEDASRLIGCFFADDLVLLASSESGLHHALSGFSAACDIAGMKTSASKTEVLHLSRNPVMFSAIWQNVIEAVEKFNYLGIAFTSDGIQSKELDVQSGKASVVMRALHRSVVIKRELSRKVKLTVFKSIFVPIFSYMVGKEQKNAVKNTAVRNKIFAKIKEV